MKYLLIICLTLSNCFAIDVTPIKKGEAASKDGFFIDSENLKEMRQINEDKKVAESSNLLLQDLVNINEQRIEIYKNNQKLYEDALVKEKTKSDMKGIGGFILGILVTSGTFYIATKIVR